ncbi:hypothetical protein PV08_10282 [Exophiala spinifera]|uniref:Uncharacterized protein n=1 Tax=Exophiala spinifera TaxID=91928 RepID=A0A0D2AW83_9EURO|nr:uncharacterized protein PV08_10282 [Exophiala spinifera]KIW10983.1 hypothetical protein PV08_10282 [Exophiala spinifera]
MPRPALRRRHLNRNAPTPRHGGKIPNSSPAKLELEKKLAHKPVGQRPTDSDDSDRLVVKGNGRRARQPQEIFASGAVGKGDTPGAYPSRAQRRKNMIRDTREILASAQQSSENSPDPNPKQPRQNETAPLTNGKVRKVSGTKQDVSAQTPAVVSSALKPSAALPGSVQPTPSRETSILGILKPRRRQPSILQDLGNESSTFDLADEEQFLPDDESTPYNLSKSHNVPITPATHSSQPSTASSKKRKFGSSDPVQSHVDERRTKSPLVTMDATTVSPEPSLPPMPVSALRQSGRKYRERAERHDDILAPPESCSSSPSSPAKVSTALSVKKITTKSSRPGNTMTTEQLRALMMPTKRRKTTRERKGVLGEFDIPADPDTNLDDIGIFDDGDGDESSFLPTQRKSRKTRAKPGRRKPLKASSADAGAVAKPANLNKQATAAAARAAKSKTKSSTEHFTATTAPVLTPSTSTATTRLYSRRNRETKSPSQLRTINFSTSVPASVEVQVENPTKSYGGSHLRRSGRQRRDTADKENRIPEDFSSNESSLYDGDGGRGRSGVAVDVEEERDKDKDRQENVRGKSSSVLRNGNKGGSSKWADIDAWDMDFEDVEVTTGSTSGSSPMRW